MTKLISYGETTRPDRKLGPSHRCDDCGRDLYVWPIPWQLAWPRRGGGDLCSDCYETIKLAERMRR